MPNDLKQFKNTGTVRIKQDGQEGEFEAVIATLNTMDKDGDYTVPGAFGQQEVTILPSHNWDSVPLGKATIMERGTEVVAVGRFNLETNVGREWYQALKFDIQNGRPLQEWSYGYRVLESSDETIDGHMARVLRKLSVHEVSPVIIGAGEGTRTVSVKKATPAHQTQVDDASWDGPANERRVRTGENVEYYNAIYAWRDPDGTIGEKQTWRFIHHRVSQEGEPGAASLRASVTGIAVLNGARGGTTIPDADRQGVWEHLARHVRDAGEEPPELKSFQECSLKLADQVRFAVWDAEAAAERLKEVQNLRQDEGRDLSDVRVKDADNLRKSLEDLGAAQKSLLEVLEKGGPGNEAEAEKLLAEFVAVETRIKGGSNIT